MAVGLRSAFPGHAWALRPYAGESFPFFDPPRIINPEGPGHACREALCARGKQSLSYFLQQVFQQPLRVGNAQFFQHIL